MILLLNVFYKMSYNNIYIQACTNKYYLQCFFKYQDMAKRLAWVEHGVNSIMSQNVTERVLILCKME